MTPEQEQKLNEVYDFVQSLKSSASIPQEVDVAVRDRFRDILSIIDSAKSATSENIGVNEAGSSEYAVLGPPDKFVQSETDDGETVYLAAWTA